MADKHHHDHLIASSSPPMRHLQSAFTAAEENGGCGEIVEVEGGHIVRSTGRKDRHSKVCTAKGPRDRRVRLSAPTAIQFYDVQDRLGFDRPSKAVDWLLKKAKSAIDDLEKLPPWNPTDTLSHVKSTKIKTLSFPPPLHEELILPFNVGIRGGGSISTGEETEHHHQRQNREEDNELSFLPQSMDSDTIKSFFPVASTQQNFHHHQQQHHQPQPLSNTQSQDLRLSLQSFQTEHDDLFSGQSTNPLRFDTVTSSWDHHSQQNHHSSELGRGFVLASPPLFQPVFNQSQISSQRGSLQSINTPMIRAWFDPHHHHHHHHHHHRQSITNDDLHHYHQSTIQGIAFTSNGEFSGFRIPPRFQGEQDNKPSSASSDSRH